MGILNSHEIKTRMQVPEYDDKLLITPLLNEEQIGPASVDLRLGSSIVTLRKTYIESQDITERGRATQLEKSLYERIWLRYGSHFVLHPNELILGVTFEYISLPKDIFGAIASRSSWGRLGLVVATASLVQPGYKGCLTLELANLSEGPITLYPGLSIAQLVLQDVPSKGAFALYEGRYDCPTEAGLPEFFARPGDDEMRFWAESSNWAPRTSGKP